MDLNHNERISSSSDINNNISVGNSTRIYVQRTSSQVSNIVSSSSDVKPIKIQKIFFRNDSLLVSSTTNDDEDDKSLCY